MEEIGKRPSMCGGDRICGRISFDYTIISTSVDVSEKRTELRALEGTHLNLILAKYIITLLNYIIIIQIHY